MLRYPARHWSPVYRRRILSTNNERSDLEGMGIMIMAKSDSLNGSRLGHSHGYVDRKD